MSNPLRALFTRALAAGVSSLVKDSESFVQAVEEDAKKVAKGIGKARQALKEVAQEIDQDLDKRR